MARGCGTDDHPARGRASVVGVGVRVAADVMGGRDRLASHEPVTWLATVSGSDDIFVEVVAASRADLFHYVNTVVRALQDVRDTHIFEAFAIYHDLRYLLGLEPPDEVN